MTAQKDYGSKRTYLQQSTEPQNDKNIKRWDLFTDDSLVYQCSHPDDYEPVGSQQSPSTSQVGTFLNMIKDYYFFNHFQDPLDQPMFPFAYQFQTQGMKPDYFNQKSVAPESKVSRNILLPKSSSSSSANSNLLPQKSITNRRIPLVDQRRMDDVFSNTDSNFTGSPRLRRSLDSISSITSSSDSTNTNSQYVFTGTNSSDSAPSNKNSSIRKTSNCWKNIQRALPPPPPAEEQYEYADIKNSG